MAATFFVLITLVVLFVGMFAFVVVAAFTAESKMARTLSGVAAFGMVAFVFLAVGATLFVGRVSVEREPARTATIIRSDPQPPAPAGAPAPPLSEPVLSGGPEVPVPPSAAPASAAGSDSSERFLPAVEEALTEFGGQASGNPAWRDSDDDLFAISHYPSVNDTIRPLLSQVRKSLLEDGILKLDESGDPQQLDRVYLGFDEQDKARAVMTATELVREFFPDASVHVTTQINQIVRNPSILLLDFHVDTEFTDTSRWDTAETASQGTVTCTASITGPTATVSRDFIEKPWVTAFDQFVSAYPDRRFIIGYSNGLASNEGEARKSALRDAVNQSMVNVNGDRVIVADERNVIDRFAQKLSRSYGEVWREAVLIEVPHDQVRKTVQLAAQGQATALATNESARISVLGGLVILSVLTVILCLVLNWVTQGYYRGQLWAALGFGGLVLAFLILAVA